MQTAAAGATTTEISPDDAPSDRAAPDQSDHVGRAGRKDRRHIVIVGGGFGGLVTAQGLGSAHVDVTLIDRRNYHLFQPLLYQVATAALSPADIAAPIRHILRSQQNAQVLLGSVQSVDLTRKEVAWDGGPLAYDYLVLAAGARHAYFGHDEWSERAPGLKTVDDAVEIRRRILLAFETAEMENDALARRAELTFVIVGGGPTGVELAGALREIAVDSIQRDFRRVDTATARIILLEGQSRVLPAMSERASAHARRDLEEMGVEVRLDTMLTHIGQDSVRVKRGEATEEIVARNVVWAAGVQASRIGKSLGVMLDRAGRVKVEADCSIPGYPSAFVIGDMAAFVDSRTGRRVPGVAQGALQMGDFVARTIAGELRGQPRGTFRYRDKGSMATIGRARAVADVGSRFYSGSWAWIVWSIVHIAFLVTFRNRIFVMAGWAWNYIAQVKGARLITGGRTPKVKQPYNS